jgi:hypothetical protein
VKTSGIRIDTYDANYASTTVGLKVAAQLASMKAGLAAATGPLNQVELKIQGILNDTGSTNPLLIPYFLNFGRELWALGRKGYSGTIGLARATDLHAKYVSYGLATATVKRIALDVFNYTIV